MAKRTKKFAPGKLNSQQIAQSWLELGIQPVPLEPRSKRPTSKKGWNTLRVTRETIPDFFEDGQNVGGLWGEPSGWIVDIDLDWPEAAALAPYLLPETFIYGRRSSSGSHYLYRCEGVSTTKLQDPKSPDAVIVEIRSTGSQSVLPPSIHPDNERYEINHDVPFKTITRRQLEEEVRSLAVGSILVRNYPEGGGRHDYIHSITGALLWGGWAEDRVRKFLSAIVAVVKDREDDPRQRERTVENTIEHFRKGDKVSGWRTLSQWLPGHLTETIRRWLAISATEALPDKILAATEEHPFDPSLLEVPGLVGEIAKWSASRAYLVQPIFDLATGLMCTALATTNKYVVDGWDTPLQPYFMLAAPTAGGKESALENVYNFARRVNLHEYVFQGFQSYHSMLDRMANPPNMACWLWDEAARKLRASRSGNSPDQAVLTWLLSLYGRANSSSPGVPGRHNAIPPIDHPFLTVLATAQPAQLMEAITDIDVSTGLVNRFLLFDVGEHLPEENLKRQMVFPSKFDEAVKRLRAIEPPTGEYPFIKVRLEGPEVWARFRDFGREARQASFRGGDMWGRSNQNALIVAGLVAVGIEPKTPMITEKIADWATRLVRWSSHRWTARMDDSSSRSRIESYSKSVERYIRNAAAFAHRAPSEKQRKLLDRGLMPKSMLMRLCRHIARRDLEDVINQLIGANFISTNTTDENEVFWVKRK